MPGAEEINLCLRTVFVSDGWLSRTEVGVGAHEDVRDFFVKGIVWGMGLI